MPQGNALLTGFLGGFVEQTFKKVADFNLLLGVVGEWITVATTQGAENHWLVPAFFLFSRRFFT